MHLFSQVVCITVGVFFLLLCEEGSAFQAAFRHNGKRLGHYTHVSASSILLFQKDKDDECHDECLSRRRLLSACISITSVCQFLGFPSQSIAKTPTTTGDSTYNHDNVETAVQELYHLVSTSRPSSYTNEQRKQIETLLDVVSDASIGREWNKELLPGTWRVAYLRPGKDGGGLDRRIPFPEFPFNESYQVFTSDTVTNIGQVLGPYVRVEVSGNLQEVDAKDNRIPKQFRADIEGGKLCTALSMRDGNSCLPLPISGVGIFDCVYLDDKLRIGKNLNGSGAIVLQVRAKY